MPQINHIRAPKPIIFHDVSEEDKRAFKKKHCFKCKRLNITLTKHDCEKYREATYSVPSGHPLKKCQSCGRFDKSESKAFKSKICKLHAEFPGYCHGDGIFYKTPGAASNQFEGKEFCSPRCGVFYNTIRKNGFNIGPRTKVQFSLEKAERDFS